MASIYEQKFQKWKEKYGELSEDTARRLDKLVRQLEKSEALGTNVRTKVKDAPVSEGTRLIREYSGKKHEVLATKDGYLYKNKLYKSLSAIAIDITGTRWNGKRFFGVCK